MDNVDQEPTWVNDYDEFVEELMINFGLHNQALQEEKGLHISALGTSTVDQCLKVTEVECSISL